MNMIYYYGNCEPAYFSMMYLSKKKYAGLEE